MPAPYITPIPFAPIRLLLLLLLLAVVPRLWPERECVCVWVCAVLAACVIFIRVIVVNFQCVKLIFTRIHFPKKKKSVYFMCARNVFGWSNCHIYEFLWRYASMREVVLFACIAHLATMYDVVICDFCKCELCCLAACLLRLVCAGVCRLESWLSWNAQTKVLFAHFDVVNVHTKCRFRIHNFNNK